MVRFQYDHNIGQWRWNISKNAEKLDEKILDTLRNSIGNNEFTYAAVGNNEFVCMSSLQPNGNAILQGTVVGIKGKFHEMPQKPSCYVKKWGEEYLLSTDDIPEGKIPTPDSDIDYRQFPSQLGYILDAVMFGSKKVVITAKNDEEVKNCIKAINYMLPPEYAKKIGFSIGGNNIPDTNISVVNDMGKTVPINVKVYFTTADKVSTSSASYYVFDIGSENPTNNYKAELSEFAKAVNDFCLYNQTQADKMIKHIADAFDADGNLDAELLKRLSLLFRFDIAPDDKASERLIEVGIGKGTDAIQRDAFLLACRHLWSHKDSTILSEKHRQKIAEAYNSNPRIFNKSDSIKYFRYLIKQNTITEKEKDILIDIAVKRDCLADNSDVIFSNHNFAVRNTVFDILKQILLKNPNIYSCERLITNAIIYFDISSYLNDLSMSGEAEKGEELFSLIREEKDRNFQCTLTAILLSSCFMATASPNLHTCTNIRFNGLCRMMTKEKMTPTQQLSFIISVYLKMSVFAKFKTINMNGISRFLCNTKWISETISSLDIEKLINLELVLIKYANSYTGLRKLVEGKLLDVKYVMPKLKKNINLRKKYIKAFQFLNKGNQYRHIAAHLRDLKNE